MLSASSSQRPPSIHELPAVPDREAQPINRAAILRPAASVGRPCQTLSLAKNGRTVYISDLSDAPRIAMSIPEGFKPLFRTSPVLDLIGPIYYVGEGKDLVLGLRAERKHCNARGTVHGGILATLADVALGYTMAFSSEPPAALVTANLTLDFAGTAKIGDWLETSVDIQRQGSRLSFANSYITVGDQRIVRASAVFLTSGQLNGQGE